ncbi:MAG TPA: hypothetical protein VGT41_06385 [Candidatus Babeliales bacterium]|nr:hypothetical protein [Candidatus Babeliales bacterium]
MSKGLLWFYLLVSSHFLISSDLKEYLYPVGVSSTNGHAVPFVYVVYQKAPDNLTLFGWDPVSLYAYPLLHSIHMPAAVRIMSDASGFSFVSNGRVWIKQFNKRSPRIISIQDSLYDYISVDWIDELAGYCCCKKRDRYGIFHFSINGDTDAIAFSDHYDCLHPQKIGSLLFYIQRLEIEGNTQYRIVQQPYPNIQYSNQSFNDTDAYTEWAKKIITHQTAIEHEMRMPDDTEHSEVVADFNNRQIMFLSMVDEDRGFVIEYGDTSSPETIDCVYHSIVRTKSGWQVNPLFNFAIPVDLISHQADRLYESLVPFVPIYHNQGIYFSDCGRSESGKASLYKYDFLSQEVAPVAVNSTEIVFAPFLFKDQLFYGGAITNQEDTNKTELHNGSICLKLPSF